MSSKTRATAYLGAILIVGITIMALLLGVVLVALIAKTGFGWLVFTVTTTAVVIVSIAEIIYREWRP